VIAESFERIHRSNLVGMGVIPFEFTGGDRARKSLGSTATRRSRSRASAGDLKPQAEVPAVIAYGDGHDARDHAEAAASIPIEIEYVEHGGVLHYVLRSLARAA
jgi:aconitate hydratase